MRCDEFADRLQQLLDRRPPLMEDVDQWLFDADRAGEAYRQHLRECDRCRKLWHGLDRLCRGLDHGLAEQPRDDFTIRVVQRATREGKQRQARQQAAAWRLLPTALAALAASWLLLAYSPASRDVARREVAAPSIAKQVRATEGGNLPQPLTAANAAANPEEYRRLLRDWFTVMAEVRLEEFDSVDQLAGELRPFATKLNLAFDGVRRSWKSGSTERT